VSMFAVRKQFYEKMRHALPPLKGGPAGEMVTLPTALPPGESCRLEYRGSSWSAINGGKSVIEAGSAARIDRVDGLTLVVHGEDKK
jgi:inner membrane protein